MTMPLSSEAYQDCEAHFARAKASPRGIAVTLPTEGQVTALAQKLNHYRERLRKESKKLYAKQPDHPQYGRSIYDGLQVAKDKENPQRLLIKPYQIDVISVEDL